MQKEKMRAFIEVLNSFIKAASLKNVDSFFLERPGLEEARASAELSSSIQNTSSLSNQNSGSPASDTAAPVEVEEYKHAANPPAQFSQATEHDDKKVSQND